MTFCFMLQNLTSQTEVRVLQETIFWKTFLLQCFLGITFSIHYEVSSLFLFVVSFLNSVSFCNCDKLWRALPVQRSYLCWRKWSWRKELNNQTALLMIVFIWNLKSRYPGLDHLKRVHLSTTCDSFLTIDISEFRD